MKSLLSLPAISIASLTSALLKPLGQSAICDAIDTDAGPQVACRRKAVWYRDAGAWALCRDHAYNPVVVDAARRRN